jgi:hypothetical protein
VADEQEAHRERAKPRGSLPDQHEQAHGYTAGDRGDG